jgi:SAM-dependent methyltransferase
MISRLQRSLRERGFVATTRSARRHLATAFDKLLDRHFDWAFGTETRTMVENANLRDVASPNLARGVRYEPTRVLPFRRVLRAARIPPDGVFVDLGCGKGRACMLAAMHGFATVVGVDYSPELCRIAEHNLGEFRSRTRRRFASSIRAMDAADYDFSKSDVVVYLFNPFDAGVLSAVIARLRRSLAAHPRRVWIVYQNPVGRDAVESTGAFALVGDWSFGGCDFAVYRSEP